MQIDDNPSLREIIRKHNLEARQSLGQHFLLDSNILRRIVEAAGDLENINVYEVGPGPGGLTRALLSAGAKRVIAIEKDIRCIEALSQLKNSAKEKLYIINGDALTFDEFSLKPQPIITVSNLPYNISTQILVKWMEQNGPFSKYVLMFQKEVANRITAKHGSKSYSRLSVLVQWRYIAKSLFNVPASAFVPRPKIESSVITLVRRPQPLSYAPIEALQAVLKASFGHRRKMLRASLRFLTENPEKILSEAAIDGKLRAEELTIQDFCALARAYVDFSKLA